MRIAFAGNPNSGKTTMYNALTGRNEKVGNWAGVTVDKKEAPIKKAYAGNLELIAVDLPGAYSMSPFTSEESITSSYVKNEHPDAIINIVDATNLSRSLFFTTQLLELGIPVVVASWQLAAAAVTGFTAKENVVGTLAICFVGLENLIDTEELALMEGAGSEVAIVFAITKVAALAYLMFNLYTPPCFAALGAMNSEINDRKWFWGGVALQFATGYVIAYLVYTIGTLITAPGSLNIVAALIGLVVVIVIVAVILGCALWYIRKEKRRGVQCVGCPDSKTCSGQCSGCTGCCHSME